MNMFKKGLIAAGVASMTLAPIAASAAPVSVSQSVSRAVPATGESDSDLRGVSRGLIFAAAAIAAVAAAFFITRDDNDDNDNGDVTPVSP